MSEFDFIYEEKQEEKKFANTLRQRINAWANSIPHHPYQNLGDNIEFISIWYKPAYPIKLFSQYEERKKEKGFRPYKNEKLPVREYFNLSEFNAWDFNLGAVDNFENSNKNYTVQGSQYMEDCHRCKAKGWISCVSCNGRGTWTCTTCSGKGKVRCSGCSGSGKVKCDNCYGRGTYQRSVIQTRQVWVPQSGDRSGYYRSEQYTAYYNESCSSCRGSGRQTCSSCKGVGTQQCSPCYGRGQITCGKCSGSGRNTCPVCTGLKLLLHYFYINRNLSYTSQETCVIHSEVFDKFPEFLENYGTYHSYNVFTNCENKLSKEQLAKGNHINPFLDKYIEKSHKEDTSSHCMLFQQAEVDCIDVLELKYKFNGKDYVMLFQGNKRTIIPGLSPIYEISFSYWQDGFNAARSYRYKKAYTLLQKARQINTFEIKDKVNFALRAVRKKIEDAFYFGVLTAFLLSAFFGGFLAYRYFADVNYVFPYASFINKPDNFLFPYHAWAQTIVFLGLIYFLLKIIKSRLAKYVVKIPGGPLLRVFAGFSVMALASVLSLLALALLNATGITIIFSFALWLLVWIIKIIIFIFVLIVKIVIWLAKAVWGILKWIVGLFT